MSVDLDRLLKLRLVVARRPQSRFGRPTRELRGVGARALWGGGEAARVEEARNCWYISWCA